MKRLRKYRWQQNKKLFKQIRKLKSYDLLLYEKFRKKVIHDLKIGYYMCGEYGENFSRPHYHACLFNISFPDQLRVENTKSDLPQFESEILNNLWQKGKVTIGELTPASAAYTAGYVTKKIRGSNAADYYGSLLPEYTACSRKPAIGLNWIEKYHTDIYNYDICMIAGKTQRPPRYYDKFYEKKFPEKMLDTKQKREYSTFFNINHEEQTEERLNVKHQIKILQSKIKDSRAMDNRERSLDLPQGLLTYPQSYDEKVIKYRKELLGQ